MNMGFKIKCTPIMQFSDDDVNNILSKYGRNLDIVQIDIDCIKRWFADQKHLPQIPTDQQIFIVLVMNKFSIEKTKEQLDMYYTIRTLMPDYFNKNLLPSSFELKVIQEMGYLLPLPKLSKNFNRIITGQIINNKTPKYSSFAFCTSLLLLLEMKSLVDVSCSDEYILDLSNITVAIVTKSSPMDVKKTVTIIEKVFANRIAAIHLVNVPSFAESLLAIIRSCLTEKLKQRFHYHMNLDSLQEFYSKEILPKDFGGDEKLMAELQIDWLKFLDQYEDHFVNLQNIKVNETLRAKKLVNDDILGFHGNFRKLAVD